MRIANSPRTWGLVAVALHWTTVILIVWMFYLGWTMTDMELGPAMLETYAFHKSLGITILGLTLARLFWRLANPTPRLPDAMPAWERRGAHASHLALYGLLLALPLVGWLYSSASAFPVSVFGLFTLPDLIGANEGSAKTLQTLHWLGGLALLGLLALHVGAALKHHFRDRDAVLRRMLVPAEPVARTDNTANKETA